MIRRINIISLAGFKRFNTIFWQLGSCFLFGPPLYDSCKLYDGDGQYYCQI